MKMTFTAKELANNVETFATYVRNGELHVDGNRLIFQLQEKLLAACPNISTIAASQFNKRFEFNNSFDCVVASAHDTIQVLAMHGKLAELTACSADNGKRSSSHAKSSSSCGNAKKETFDAGR
jgi:hypothetical protein